MPARNRRVKEYPPRYRSRRPAPESRPLTKRELEVVEWIAEGKRNREIAKILGCSARTVQKHVEHILEKLQVETRTAVCIWCIERRMGGDGRVRTRRKPSRG